tara:strand:- start:1602 stop:2444 length:843 start_codon:yes stop_codon:yes gene_type:complete
MPLDFVHPMPESLDFNVEFETTKMEDKKYVINGDTGEYIGIVGTGFNCVNHKDFFTDVISATTDALTAEEAKNASITWRSAHKNGWAMMDMMLPNMSEKITTDKHETTVMKRVIALHGVNGTCANTTIFGAIDFFCLNGQIRGKHDKVMRKNTSNFNLDTFIRELKKSQEDFKAQTKQMQRWAETSIATIDVVAKLETIMLSKKKAEKMYMLYNQEVSRRGRNLWSLYSAFTNYASYADERNGFNLRNTGNDTQAISMFKREIEVASWIDTPTFRQLEAA